MHNQIDYNSIAGIYDIYANTDYDFNFFVNEIKQANKIVELTSGTGRLSMPLIAAGADLTCIDISQGMLDVLSEKLKDNNYSAKLICADIEHLDLEQQFDLAILPFQSFMELVGEKKQRNTLSSVYRCLLPGGRFFCTMHNPEIRRKTIDSCLRIVGIFPYQDGKLVVSGFEQGGTPVVSRSQFFEFYNKAGELQSKKLLRMEFELIEREQFNRIAIQAGFKINTLYGGYDCSEFESTTSPVMIWELMRPRDV